MWPMDRDWGKLGRDLAKGRSRLGLSQVALAKAIGVTRTPIQAIERGDHFEKVTGTMRSYARMVGWTDDAIDTVLAGGEPTTVTDDAPDAAETSPAAAKSDLPLRIVHELTDGDSPLLDATTITLPSANAKARMTIVVRGEPDASPEEIRDALLAWRRTERRLQDVDGEGQSPATDTP